MQNSLQPFKILAFLWFSALGLLAISWFIPENGISFGSFLSIKYPSFKSIMYNEKPKYAAIPSVVAKADAASLQVVKNAEKQINKQKPLVVEPAKGKEKQDNTPIQQTDIQSQKIEFPGNNSAILYRFFEKLEQAAIASSPVRIIHYGDSQIEGDRISGFIRERLQSRFGGGGPGLQPASQFYKQANVTQTNSGNWYRYTLFGQVDKSIKHNGYGAMAIFSRFTPAFSDTANSTENSSSILFNSAKSIYPSAKKFQQIKIYYGNSHTENEVVIEANGKNYGSHILEAKTNYDVATINLENPSTLATLTFKGIQSADIYGIALDMPYGVAVDNIAMRGGSGTIFNKMNRQLLSNMLQDLNTELVIMQFGGNVLPYIKDAKACEDYGNWFYSQLATIKAAKPGVAIIVIGPADMSMKVNDYFETYTYLENVRDALKQAAFKAGAGFWDMYSAMGGKNSMPSWVAANPPLAASDYVHFSPKGARIIAELFYEALNHEYEKYRYQKKNLINE